jgi:hypothetical protein
MAEKRLVDQIRESGGSFTVGTADEGQATETFTLADSLFIIKEKAIYKINGADQIDPHRENANLPRFAQQKILDYGSESQLVGRIFLTAKTLLKKEFLPEGFPHEHALLLSFEALTDTAATHSTAQGIDLATKEAIATAVRVRSKNSSMVVPSVADIKTRCKTFIQKADHVIAKLFDIVKLFYPELKKGRWDALNEYTRDRYGESDNFTNAIESMLPFLRLVRNTRDCLEHGNLDGVVVTDFTLRADGMIDPPTIEVDFRTSHQSQLPLTSFTQQMAESIVTSFEAILAHLCSKHVREIAGFPIEVGFIPEGAGRRYKDVRYAHGIYNGDEFKPIY